MTDRPAVLGGEPAFSPALPFARPTIEQPEEVLRTIASSLETGMVTSGPLVAELEERAADLFQVRHCVAVSSCTSGLILVVQALTDGGSAVVPSFTFSATAHAVAWNGLKPEFADCDPDTWCLPPTMVPDHARLVVAVHVSGVPCDVRGLQARCDEIGATLVFDAAHGAGSTLTVDSGPIPLGSFGKAEVFSLTPTKVLSGAEGGLITTNDAGLATHLRLAREYGNPGDYDTRFVGLNARMSELNAALALASVDHLSERVAHRNAVADLYRRRLGTIPGIGFQSVPDGAISSFKDFTILIDRDQFGLARDAFRSALEAEGIGTRPYYSPPVHRQRAYAHLPVPDLPVTDSLAARVTSLPIWSHLNLESVESITDAISRIHHHAEEVESALASP